MGLRESPWLACLLALLARSRVTYVQTYISSMLQGSTSRDPVPGLLEVCGWVERLCVDIPQQWRAATSRFYHKCVLATASLRLAPPSIIVPCLLLL